MSRITTEERERFHQFLDQAIDKLETPKNSMKPHWTHNKVLELRDMVMVEAFELNHATNLKSGVKIISELKDIINTCLFMWDNIKRPNRINK